MLDHKGRAFAKKDMPNLLRIVVSKLGRCSNYRPPPRAVGCIMFRRICSRLLQPTGASPMTVAELGRCMPTSGMKREFPPQAIADLAKPSASALMFAARRLSKGAVVLFLGSGVSASAGLPIWNELLVRICTVFFAHWEFDYKDSVPTPSAPRNLSIAMWEAFEWDDELRQLAKKYAAGDPLLKTQQIKNCIRPADWRYLVKKVLYGTEVPRSWSLLLDQITRLCARPNKVAAVVNFNFDSILEERLGEAGLRYTVVCDPDVRPKPDSLPVLHPHGYLKRGGGPKTRLVLGEEDYFETAHIPYGWPDIAIVAYLSTVPCLFIGHSMTDPNVRRLLRLSSTMAPHWHFAFLPGRFGDAEDRMAETLFDADLARLRVRVIRYRLSSKQGDDSDDHSRLPELLNVLLAATDDPDAWWRTASPEMSSE